MKTLLVTNRKERSKIKKSLVTGSGADDVYKSKWFASEYLIFLNDKDKPLPTKETDITTSNNNTQTVNESISNDEQVASDSASSTQQQVPSDLASSTQQAPSNSSSSTQQAPSYSASSTQQQLHNTSFRKKRRGNDDVNDEKLTEAVGLLKHSVQYLSKEEDCYISFGTHIAHELGKYDSRTLSLVKHAINNIIFQANMGQLPGQSYGYYTSPYSTDLTHSTSPQSNYHTPSPAQTDTSAPEPQREAEDAQNV